MAKSNSTVAAQRRAQWQDLLGRWTASGMPQAQFCRGRGIPVWKFLWWKKRLSTEVAAGPVHRVKRSPELAPRQRAERRRSAFVPLQVVTPAAEFGALRRSADDCELTLRGGRVLRFHAAVEVTKLAEIVMALEALPC